MSDIEGLRNRILGLDPQKSGSGPLTLAHLDALEQSDVFKNRAPIETYDMPDGSTYVIAYGGCGTNGVLQSDGTWTITEDHATGCKHQEPTT